MQNSALQSVQLHPLSAAYRLSVGAVAHCLRPRRPDKKEISWQAVYYHFQKWSADGSLEQVWVHSIQAIRGDLDLSQLNLDGSRHMLRKLRREIDGNGIIPDMLKLGLDIAAKRRVHADFQQRKARHALSVGEEADQRPMVNLIHGKGWQEVVQAQFEFAGHPFRHSTKVSELPDVRPNTPGNFVLVERLVILAQVQADAALCDFVTARLYLRQHSGLVIAPDFVTHEPYAVATRVTSNHLAGAINAALNAMDQDGTLAAILSRLL